MASKKLMICTIILTIGMGYPYSAFADNRIPEVPRFGIFETSFRHEGDHSNPYTQLEATATLTRPAGDTVTIPLFWDGGDVWRLRFSPDTVGQWTWTTQSRDAGLDAKSGSLDCVASQNKGGIRPMTGYPHHFEYQDGTPFWLFGDTHWSAFGNDPKEKMNRAALEHYADVRAAQGFNFIHAILTSPGENEGGPFFHDLKNEKINPMYFQDVDKRVTYLNGRGFTVMIILNWANPQNYIPVWQRFPSDESRLRFAKYAAARYSTCNVCFGVVGEWEGKWKPETLREIGLTVERSDPHDRMIAVHCTLRGEVKPHWAVGKLASEPWMSFGAYLQNYSNLHNQVLRSRIAGKPVVNSEYGYYLRDLNGDGRVDKPYGESLQSMRGATYDIAMAGSYFVTGFGVTYWGGYRDPDIFNPDNPKYLSWVEDVQHIQRLFTSLEWWRLAPHDDWVTGPGIHYCLAEPGRQYLVYVREARAPITLLLHARPNTAPYAVRRFDPRTGGYDQLKQHTIGDALILTPPTQEDYIFLITGESVTLE